MYRRRWLSRLAIAFPVLLVIGLVAGGMATVGTADANTSSPAISIPCPSVSGILATPVSTLCKIIKKVKRKVKKTVHHLTGGSGGSSGSGGKPTPSTRTSGSPTPSGRHPRPHRNHHHHKQRGHHPVSITSSGGLTPFNMKDWLTMGTGAASAAGQFPLLSPAHPGQRGHRAALAAKGSAAGGQGPIWLLAVLGTVGLLGGAGGHFLGWPGLRRRRAGPAYAQPRGPAKD